MLSKAHGFILVSDAFNAARLHDEVTADPVWEFTDLTVMMPVGVLVGVVVEAGFTITETDDVTLPPLDPEATGTHAMLYVAVPVTVGVSTAEPFVGSLPDHASEAVQEETFLEVHMSVVELPMVIVSGDAVSVTAAVLVEVLVVFVTVIGMLMIEPKLPTPPSG